MKKTRLTIILLMILTLVSAIITLCMGAVRIPVQDTLSILLRHLFGTDTGTSVSVAFEQIVWQIRMPRIILGFLAGSGLALCGCVMQAVVQNPMADPYILGVSAGATLGATGSLFLGLGVISGFWAFVGAGGACFLAQHQAIQRLRLRPEKDCCRQYDQCDKADVFPSGAGQGAHRPELDGHHTVRIACYRNDKVGKCCQQCIDNHAGENQLD